MQSFREIFETYGANYQSTMDRFVGNETLYLKFLDMLFQDENLQILKESIETGNLEEAFGAAHTLKGVTANMGLTPLYDAVCEMIEPLRKKEVRDDYLIMYQNIETEFKKADILREQLKGGE